MSSTEVLDKLSLLSQDEENQNFIAGDETCMKGLITFLQDADANIVEESLKIIFRLSGDSENCQCMVQHLGLVPSIRALMLEYGLRQSSKKLASDIYTNIQDFLEDAPTEAFTVKINCVSKKSQSNLLLLHNNNQINKINNLLHQTLPITKI